MRLLFRPLRLTLLSLLPVIILFLLAQPVQAETPTADPYEPNETIQAASTIPSVATLPDLTIFPAGDVDTYRFLAVPGPLRIKAYGTPGLDLELTIYDGSGNPLLVANDPSGPNVSYATPVGVTGYFVFSLRSTTPMTGFYQLEVFNTVPTATLTPTVTGTPQPTATPLYTPTPNLGGKPDSAEPNSSFNTAYRIAPGSELQNLNFNPGVDGQKDNDFFVMAVRSGVPYTCQTKDLGPNLDTNLIVYSGASFDLTLAGNDDEDTLAGKINSKTSFTTAADQDIYLLVGYKYPTTEDLRYPGAATYSLLCSTGLPSSPSSAGGTGSYDIGASGALPPPTQPANATPLAIALFSQPQPTPAPTAVPLKTTTLNIVVAYDSNTDRKGDPSEGVEGLIVHVIDTVTNQELAKGVTDQNGGLQFTVASNHPLRLSIPYLAAAQDFQAGNPATWIFLIPPANVPGLIP